MKLTNFESTEYEKNFAKALDMYCRALNLDYYIQEGYTMYSIIFKSEYGSHQIHCDKNSLFEEFSKFLYGVNFGMDIMREKYNI